MAKTVGFCCAARSGLHSVHTTVYLPAAQENTKGTRQSSESGIVDNNPKLSKAFIDCILVNGNKSPLNCRHHTNPALWSYQSVHTANTAWLKYYKIVKWLQYCVMKNTSISFQFLAGSVKRSKSNYSKKSVCRPIGLQRSASLPSPEKEIQKFVARKNRIPFLSTFLLPNCVQMIYPIPLNIFTFYHQALFKNSQGRRPKKKVLK